MMSSPSDSSVRLPARARAVAARSNTSCRALSVVRDVSLARWIAHEFQHLRVPLLVARSLGEALAADSTDLLIAFIDELSAEELRQLIAARSPRSTAEVVALSRYRMAPALRRALGVHRVLTPPFVQDLFGDILAELGGLGARPPGLTTGATASAPRPE
jgi:hypothetical protein